jgi:hypothetical protein
MAFITFIHGKIRESNPEMKAETLFATISAILMAHFDTHPVTAQEIDILTKAITAYNEVISRESGK